ncbi:MAG: hypothetical protein AAF092_10155 [Pseudomonadota bacterium]
MGDTSFLWWAFRFLQEAWYLPVLFFCFLLFYVTAPLAHEDKLRDMPKQDDEPPSKDSDDSPALGGWLFLPQILFKYVIYSTVKIWKWWSANWLSNWGISRLSIFVGAGCLVAFLKLSPDSPSPNFILSEQEFFQYFGLEEQLEIGLWDIAVTSETGANANDEEIFLYTITVTSTSNLPAGFVLFPIVRDNGGKFIPQQGGHIEKMDVEGERWVGIASSGGETDNRLSITASSSYPLDLAYFVYRKRDLDKIISKEEIDFLMFRDIPRTIWCRLENTGDISRCHIPNSNP